MGDGSSKCVTKLEKGLIVMLSIALSMVVVNCIVMLVQGYDFDSYRKVVLASDFQLDQMTDTLSNTNFNGITPEIKEILNKCPESEKTGYVYYSEERHKMEPALLKTWETLAEKTKKTGQIMKSKSGRKQKRIIR